MAATYGGRGKAVQFRCRRWACALFSQQLGDIGAHVGGPCGDGESLQALIAAWPADVRAYIAQLLGE